MAVYEYSGTRMHREMIRMGSRVIDFVPELYQRHIYMRLGVFFFALYMQQLLPPDSWLIGTK